MHAASHLKMCRTQRTDCRADSLRLVCVHTDTPVGYATRVQDRKWRGNSRKLALQSTKYSELFWLPVIAKSLHGD